MPSITPLARIAGSARTATTGPASELLPEAARMARGTAARQAAPGSRVLDVVEGVELLANPRLPDKLSTRVWGVPEGATVFGRRPDARVSIEHIDQGTLGDCWSLSTMGALAHREPEVIANLVRESGDHVIVAFPDRPVAVTRELPLEHGEPRFAATGNDDPVLWPAYVEKAQAALAPDGYRSLDGGFASEAFQLLLGRAPRDVDAAGSIARDLERAYGKGLPTVIGSRIEGDFPASIAKRMEQLDVLDTHYYTVRDVRGSGDDMVATLFNPWGDTHPQPLGPSDLTALFDDLTTPAAARAYS